MDLCKAIIIENSRSVIFLYVVFATARARIFRAPAARSARTASAKVAPEVVTSSISIMFLFFAQMPVPVNGFAA